MGATIYCLCNQKGGCAKTVSSISIGIGLAREGRRVLLVDVDSQGSMTASLGYQQPDQMETTLSTILSGIIMDEPLPPGSGILHHEEGVDLLPANIELSGIKEVRDMMMDDELELDKLGDRKTALFCIVSDTDTTFNFIASMVYTQMFNTLCDKALENGGALKTHVTCLLDEFANQKIPNFEHLISVIRSREISAHVIVQTQSQLKAVYKDHAETIIGNCSCVLFLGGKEQSTLKEISAMLGKETIVRPLGCMP